MKSVGVVLALLVAWALIAQGAHAYTIDGAKQEDGNNAQAWGNATVDSVDDTHYKVTVNVTTRVRGRGQTARGGALYIGYDANQNPIVHVGMVQKYCSTDLTRNDRECGNSDSLTVRSAWLDQNVVFEQVVIQARHSDGLPDTWSDVWNLVKDNINPADVWEQVKNLGVGQTQVIGASVFRRRK